MKKYTNPEVEVLVLATEDVVTVSVVSGNANENDLGKLDIGNLFNV